MSENISEAFSSQIEKFGIKPSKIHRNYSAEKLVEMTVQKNEGIVTSTGSLSVNTGKYTGRSPEDLSLIHI